MTEYDVDSEPSETIEWLPVRVEVAEYVAEGVRELHADIPWDGVPAALVHDSVVTKALEYIAVKDAYVGRDADGHIASETVDRIVQHGELPDSDAETEVVTLHLPPGKQSILKAVSRVCTNVNRPSEMQAFTALLALGVDELGG